MTLADHYFGRPYFGTPYFDVASIGTSSFCFETYCYPTSVAGIRTLGVKGRTSVAPTNCNYTIRANGAELEFAFRDAADANWHIWSTTGLVLAVNTWYLVGVNFTFGDGKSIEVYVNKNRITGSWTSGDGNATPIVNTSPLYLGAWNAGGAVTEPWAGRFARTKVYPRRLTHEEHVQHWWGIYMRGATLLELNYNDGSGSAVVDTSGNSLNGVITGTANWYLNDYTPNSQNQFGCVPYFEDRTYGGLTEAQNLGSILLWRGRQPTRYVEGHIPLDLRRRAGQYTLVLDPSFRGRAGIEDLEHRFHDSKTVVTLAYR